MVTGKAIIKGELMATGEAESVLITRDGRIVASRDRHFSRSQLRSLAV